MSRIAEQNRFAGLSVDLDFDELEPRVMLAGDVTAVFDGSTLTLTGDGSANEVHVLRFFDSVEIVGTAGTSINGGQGIGAIDPASLSNLTANLGGGADVLSLNTFGSGQLTLTGDLNVTTAGGGDLVVLGARIGSGSGDAPDLLVLGESDISLGIGNDTSWVEDVQFGDASNENGFSLRANDGDDDVTTLHVSTGGNLFTDLGEGASNSYAGADVDVGRDMFVNGGSQFDFVLLNDVVVGTIQDPNTVENANITLKGGDDLVSVVGPVVTQDRFRVVGGQGTDTVEGSAMITASTLELLVENIE